MSGDKVCSPDPESVPISTYYSHSPDIPTYQKALFLHVYIQLWPFKKTLPSKNLPAHARVLLILISNTRGQETKKYTKSGCSMISKPFVSVIRILKCESRRG